MQQSKTITKIAPALLAAQKKIGAAEKKGTNPFFHSSYAELGSVMEACKDALNDNGITVLQPVGTNEKGVFVETFLLHESGEWMSESMKIAPKSETDPQAQGSAISYARRYSLQSMMFIPSEDDDANKASSKDTGVAKKEKPQYTGSREPAATQKQVNYLKKLMEALKLPIVDDKTIFGWGIKKVSDLISQYKDEIDRIAIGKKDDTEDEQVSIDEEETSPQREEAEEDNDEEIPF